MKANQTREGLLTLATIAAPVVLTWVICAIGIGASQLRGDELCTWWAATLPFESFERLIDHVDAVLAPYYLFMRQWIGVFGDSEAALRAPAAIAMGLTAGLVAALGIRLANRSVGLRAGLVFAVVPIVSRYGQEARPYAFAALFATLSCLLLLRLIEKSHSVDRGVAYALALVALGLSHVVALLVLAAHAACFVQVRRKAPRVQIAWRPFIRFAIFAGIAVATVFILLVVGAGQHAEQIGRQGSVAELTALARKLWRVSTPGSLVVGALLAIAVLRSMFSSKHHSMIRLWAIVPPLFLLATYSVLHLWALRYLVFTLPAIALLVGNGLELPATTMRARAGITIAAVGTIVALGWSMQVKSRSSLARTSGDYREMGKSLAAAAPGDAVAFGGRRVHDRIPRLALAYQMRGARELHDIFVARSMEDRARFTAVECPRPQACLPASQSRLWLLTSAPVSDIFAGMPDSRAKLLREQFAVHEVTAHWNANLALLIRKPDEAPGQGTPRERHRAMPMPGS